MRLLIQTSQFGPRSVPLLAPKQSSLGWEGIPNMTERAWEQGKGHWASPHCEKVFSSLPFVFCPETLCLHGGLVFGLDVVVGSLWEVSVLPWGCCPFSFIVTSLDASPSPWRERALSRDVMVLGREACRPAHRCSLLLNLWSNLQLGIHFWLFGCFLGGLLWDKDNFCAWDTLKSLWN